MQVHKESIDRIPNALSNRGNIDIEIYGMEGIPEADLRQHEKNKGPPEVPMTYPEAVAPKPPPVPAQPPAAPPNNMLPLGYIPFPGPNMGGMMPPMPYGMPPLNSQFPAMPPHISGGFPGAPPAVSVPNSLLGSGPSGNAPPNVITTSSAPSAPPAAATAKPLFPSLAGTSNLSTAAPPNATPASNSSSSQVKIVTIIGNSRIIHPEDDLSLEELRTRLPRYKHLNLETAPVPAVAKAPPASNGATQALPPPPPGAMAPMYGNGLPNLANHHHLAPPHHLAPNMYQRPPPFIPQPQHHHMAQFQQPPSFRPAY